MDLGAYVDNLRRELTLAADARGDDALAVAERLLPALDSALRLTLLDALSGAADEITRELAPGSVHLRLRGREPDFVVSMPAAGSAPADAPAASPAPPSGQSDATDGATSRINFRPPESLKSRIEEAAGRDGLSVNAWLVRAATAALEPADRAPHSGAGRLRGWVG